VVLWIASTYCTLMLVWEQVILLCEATAHRATCITTAGSWLHWHTPNQTPTQLLVHSICSSRLGMCDRSNSLLCYQPFCTFDSVCLMNERTASNKKLKVGLIIHVPYGLYLVNTLLLWYLFSNCRLFWTVFNANIWLLSDLSSWSVPDFNMASSRWKWKNKADSFCYICGMYSIHCTCFLKGATHHCL